jgi:hypothetical protein
MTHPTAQAKQPIDLREKGAPRDGVPQTCDRRLYLQLQVYTGCQDTTTLAKALEKSGLESVLYCDVNDPRGVGILLMNEDPGVFTGDIRSFLLTSPFSDLTPRPEMTMFGRTYSIGREADLEDWLLTKPRRRALNPKWPWAVWYPLRRKSEFELLSREEQGKILMEHAMIGMSYGGSDLAHDIRLACYGLDQNDNEFVLGLLGSQLHPLSRIVQDMRKTQQTAKYIQSLGPFFIGKVFWQSAFPNPSLRGAP